jgi:cytochrome c peroxidase
MGFKRLFASSKMGARKWVVAVAALGFAGVVSAAAVAIPNLFPFLDPTGFVSTYNTTGPIQQNGAFFQSLGTNGRSCSTCHIAANAMGLSLQNVQARYLLTAGRDPLFASFDGANCPNLTSRTPQAHSILLSNGLIRIPITLPASPQLQFTIRAIVDPNGCAISTDPATGRQVVSIYRRPLPTTNLKFLSAVMWDGRESAAFPLSAQGNLTKDLMQQAIDATLEHAQASVAPTEAQQNDIVQFETGLFSAQIADAHAGLLNSDGATGGAQNLANTGFEFGINDVLGADPNHNPFNPSAFSLFSAWQNATPRREHGPIAREVAAARADIAAGEVLFNTRAINITNVRGINDNAAVAAALGVSLPVASFPGTCTTCHDTPNVGDHSVALPLDLGLVHDPAQEHDPDIASSLAQLSLAKVPVYEIDGCPDPFAVPPSTQPVKIYTTDPGKALISGACGDVNRVKGPILRGLAARAPYFHNGAARNLDEVLNFYNQRFQMNLTATEKRQIIAFLNSL